MSRSPQSAQFDASSIHDHVARMIAIAPPLTNEQREKVAALLRVGSAMQARA